MCQEAIEQGLVAIAFTDHKEFAGDFPAWFKGVDQYFYEIERTRRDFSANSGQPLAILSGVELGNPHEHIAEASKFVETYPFDVKIASLHWLYGENIHNRRCFKRRDIHEVLADYFVAATDMVNDFDCDILAHFDRILLHPSFNNTRYDISKVEDEVRAMCEAVIARNVVLELNTRHLARSAAWRGSLSTMLGWYQQAGGRTVLINSDAHRTSHLCANFELAFDLASSAGLGLESDFYLSKVQAA